MHNSERHGLLLALAGFALLSLGDAIIKTMAGAWSPIAVAALRFSIAAVVLAALLSLREGAAALRPAKPSMQLARGACLAGATLCFFTAIFVMPLAEATALIFAAPVLTALLSGPLLKERVPPATWFACLAAFAGVLIILRPNLAALGVVALLPLIAAVFMSLLMIANRAVAGQGSALSMQAFIACIAAPILTIAALAGDWGGITGLEFGWPSVDVVLRCAAVAVTASCAHWLVFLGTTRAGAASVAPMSYVQLLVASALGWAWFGDRPDAMTLLGAAIIIGAGLLLWWRAPAGQAPPPVEMD